MKQVFADTAYFIALLNADDAFHEAAHDLSASDRRPLLTTSAIVQELGARFNKRQDRRFFLAIVAALNHGTAEVLHVDESLQAKGIERFTNRPDKDWSLADCISFIVMEDRAMHEAATSDHHFEEAGFTALLRRKNK